MPRVGFGPREDAQQIGPREMIGGEHHEQAANAARGSLVIVFLELAERLLEQRDAVHAWNRAPSGRPKR